VKTVADRYRQVAHHKSTGHGFLVFLTSMTLNDLQLPKKVFGEFFAFFVCNAHFKSELSCDEMAEDRPRQPTYEFFSIKHKF